MWKTFPYILNLSQLLRIYLVLCRHGGKIRQSLCSRDGHFGETRQRERKVSTTALNSQTMVKAGVAAQRKATTGRLSKSRKIIFKQFSGVIERDLSLTQGGQDVGRKRNAEAILSWGA